MPRNYIRKRNTEMPQEQDLRPAIQAVLSKQLSIRAAAEKFNLKKTTLASYCRKQTILQSITLPLVLSTPIKRQQHHTQVFSRQQEEQLSSYLKSCCLLNHGLTTMETRVLAHQYAVANNVNCHESWFEQQKASADWLTGFLKRNPQLSIRKPEATSQARAAGFNRPVVNQFYSNLLNLLTKYNFGPSDIWNCDETNVPTVMQPPDVIATKGLKQVR